MQRVPSDYYFAWLISTYISYFELSFPGSEVRIKEIQLKTELRLGGMTIEVLLMFRH